MHYRSARLHARVEGTRGRYGCHAAALEKHRPAEAAVPDLLRIPLARGDDGDRFQSVFVILTPSSETPPISPFCPNT